MELSGALFVLARSTRKRVPTESAQRILVASRPASGSLPGHHSPGTVLTEVVELVADLCPDDVADGVGVLTELCEQDTHITRVHAELVGQLLDSDHVVEGDTAAVVAEDDTARARPGRWSLR